jgi:hypothetical protein
MPKTMEINEKTLAPIGFSWKLGGVIVSLAATIAVGGFRINSAEARITKVEEFKEQSQKETAHKDIHLQKIDDAIEHMRETMDRVDKNVEELRRR